MDSIEILVSIRKIVRSLNLESKSIQKEFGLSITQLLTLGHLINSQRYTSTQKKIMDVLSLNSSTVTGIINRLEKKGYVARVYDLSDRRSKSITLTASGLKLMDETPNILHDRLSQKLASLSVHEQTMIKHSLEIIVSAMQIKEVDASPLLTPEEPIN